MHFIRTRGILIVLRKHSSAGRASGSQPEGHGFEPRCFHFFLNRVLTGDPALRGFSRLESGHCGSRSSSSIVSRNNSSADDRYAVLLVTAQIVEQMTGFMIFRMPKEGPERPVLRQPVSAICGTAISSSVSVADSGTIAYPIPALAKEMQVRASSAMQ